MQRRLISFLFFVFLILHTNISFTQVVRKFNISGTKLRLGTMDSVKTNFFSGPVFIEHQGTTIECDSAQSDVNRVEFKAFGHVHVLTKDSVHIYSDRLFYSRETEDSHFYGHVKLIDSTSTLTTEDLVYNRDTEIAVFNQWGTIVDDSTTLVSKKGEYYKESKSFLFMDSVEVVNPKYTINTDTLWYKRETAFMHFSGPTTIIGKNKYVFAVKGWMDTKNDITSLKTNAYIKDEDQIIQGDTVYYDKGLGYGYAYDGASFEDKKNDLILSGKIFEYIKKKGFAYTTDSALAIIKEEKDSLYLHADTIKIMLDSLDKAESLRAYTQARFYRKDLQGICGELIYSIKDSVIKLYNQPVLWANENQLSSDSSKLYMSNRKADSLMMYNSAFIATKDSLEFNQIKGRNVVGYFKEGNLSRITVNGNSETIYYIRDEKTKELNGMMKALASNMVIYLKDKKVSSIVYIDQPKSTIFPIEKVLPNEKHLEGFLWYEDSRPLNRIDVFRKVESKETTDPLNLIEGDELNAIKSSESDKSEAKQKGLNV